MYKDATPLMVKLQCTKTTAPIYCNDSLWSTFVYAEPAIYINLHRRRKVLNMGGGGGARGKRFRWL